MTDSKVDPSLKTSKVISKLKDIYYQYDRGSVLPVIWCGFDTHTYISSVTVDGMEIYKIYVGHEDVMKFVQENVGACGAELSPTIFEPSVQADEFSVCLLLVYAWGGVFQYGNGTEPWDDVKTIPSLIRNMNRRDIQFFQNHNTLAAKSHQPKVRSLFFDYPKNKDRELGMKKSRQNEKTVITTCPVIEYTKGESDHRSLSLLVRMNALALTTLGFIWFLRR